jgi:hypothetical protein
MDYLAGPSFPAGRGPQGAGCRGWKCTIVIRYRIKAATGFLRGYTHLLRYPDLLQEVLR